MLPRFGSTACQHGAPGRGLSRPPAAGAASRLNCWDNPGYEGSMAAAGAASRCPAGGRNPFAHAACAVLKRVTPRCRAPAELRQGSQLGSSTQLMQEQLRAAGQGGRHSAAAASGAVTRFVGGRLHRVAA